MATLPRVLPWLPLVAGHDYWLNQVLELLVGFAGVGLLMGLGGWPRAELGLRLRFAPGTGRDVRHFLLPLLALEVGLLGILISGGQLAGLGYLLLQLSAGPTEELIFRGLLLALLNRAFLGRVRVLGADLGWGTVASAVLFEPGHGLRVGAGWRVALDVVPMAIPMAGGLVLAWCQARSGSLLLPVLVHSGMNAVAQLIGPVKMLWRTLL